MWLVELTLIRPHETRLLLNLSQSSIEDSCSEQVRWQDQKKTLNTCLDRRSERRMTNRQKQQKNHFIKIIHSITYGISLRRKIFLKTYLT